MSTIAVLGVGRVGSAIARAALRARYEVTVAASGSADDIALLTEIVLPGARAMTGGEAVASADIVVVAVPLHKYRTVDPAPLAGKIVIDAMNYWSPVDGVLDEFEDDTTTSSEVIEKWFSSSRVVKTFNHIGYHELEEDARPAGAEGRRAIAVASDDMEAADAAMEMIDRFGFDPVYIGPLHAGRDLQPGTEIFAGTFTASALDQALDLERTPTL